MDLELIIKKPTQCLIHLLALMSWRTPGMIISDANSCENNITNQSEIQEQKLGYVYRHIRLDTNMPFYIGISSINDGKYSRSKEKDGRNKYWKNIINKTEYRVEILLKNVPLDILCEKEKYFIKLYGRVDKGLGTLVNMTDGGDKGTPGIIVSEETRKRISYTVKKNMTDETRKKQSDAKKGKKLSPETIEKLRQCNTGKKMSKESIEKTRKGNSKPVGKYKDGILIKEYPSARATGIDGYSFKHVSSCCLGKRENHRGFQWKFL